MIILIINASMLIAFYEHDNKEYIKTRTKDQKIIDLLYITIPQKIIVIGCPGSGKSYFSKELAKKTKLPVIHLDMIYWKPN